MDNSIQFLNHRAPFINLTDLAVHDTDVFALSLLDVKELAQEVVDIWMKVIKGEPGTKDKKKHSDSEERKEDNTWKMEMRNGICVIKKVDVDASASTSKKGASTGAEEESVKEAHTDGEEDESGEGNGDESGDGKGDEEPQKNIKDGDVTAMEVDGEEGDKESEGGDGNKTASLEAPKGAESPAVVKDSDTKSKGDKKDDESKSPRGKKREHSSSRSDSKSKRKSSDKSSDRGSDKHSSSKDKSKSSSSSKHSSKDSSRSRKSHHKDHRDRHRSRESEKQREREKEKEREREKEKERQRKRQSEKDRETLAKVQGQSLSLGKLGAIPKKKSTDPDKKDSSGSFGSAVAAGDGLAATKKPLLPTPGDRRAPTVKTFGAKFRSTGLEDAVSTAAAPKRKPSEPARPPPPPPKRAPAPEPPTVSAAADKRSRIEQRPPVERPGGIKVIPPKREYRAG